MRGDALNDNELVVLSVHEFLRDNKMKCGWFITNTNAINVSYDDRPMQDFGEPVFRERSERFPLGFCVFRNAPVVEWRWTAKFLRRWKPRWRVAYVPVGGFVTVTDLDTAARLVHTFELCDPDCFDQVLEFVR